VLLERADSESRQSAHRNTDNYRRGEISLSNCDLGTTMRIQMQNDVFSRDSTARICTGYAAKHEGMMECMHYISHRKQHHAKIVMALTAGCSLCVMGLPVQLQELLHAMFCIGMQIFASGSIIIGAFVVGGV
jgi:hypothetical protein